jgi:hypothetical protein
MSVTGSFQTMTFLQLLRRMPWRHAVLLIFFVVVAAVGAAVVVVVVDQHQVVLQPGRDPAQVDHLLHAGRPSVPQRLQPVHQVPPARQVPQASLHRHLHVLQ